MWGYAFGIFSIFLRMQHATNQLDNPLKIAETKRDIARVKTVICEKEEK